MRKYIGGGVRLTYVFYETKEHDYPLEYRFRCENQTLSNSLMEDVDYQIKSFLGKYGSIVKDANMDISVKPTQAKRRGIPEYECNINLITKRGIFHSNSKGIGTKKSINKAIEAIQTQLFSEKSRKTKRIIARDKDPYMAVEYRDEFDLEEEN